MRALVCDDDATVRLIARRVLEDQYGCSVVECLDGREALIALGRAAYDFALLDVDMPILGGFETLRLIRGSAASDLPVIIMTAERDQETVVKLVQLGVSGYIVKPLSRSRLVATVDTVMRTLA